MGGRDLPAEVTAPACPACGAGGTTPVETVATPDVAAVWAREWPTTPRPSAAEVGAWIAADLGATEVTFRRCPGCGLEFARPMRSWTAGHYPAQSHGLGFDHAQALGILATMPPADVLEVGCGEGEFLERAAALGHRAIGLDFSPGSVAAALSRGVDARLMDLKQLGAMPGRPDGFDAIGLFQVVEHLEDPDAVFADLARVARPGAWLFLGCPAPDRFSRRLAHAQTVGSSDFWDFPPQHTLRWTGPALTAFLARHGWAVERVEAEPYSAVGAAAALVAINGHAGGWYAHPVRRRVATALMRLRLGAAARRGPLTGIRLFAAARRGPSAPRR